MRLRRRLLTGLVTATLLLAGCSATSEEPAPEDPLTGVDLSAASALQTKEIEDRVATADEYTAAFDRYRECLSAAGYELADVVLEKRVYRGGIPEEAVNSGVHDDCYEAEYKYTDMLWQSSDLVQNGSDTADFLRQCLQDRGIDPQETLKEMEQQLLEAGIETPECL